MKKKIPTFIAGMITMAAIMSMVVAVAASNGMKITVDPTIKIMVNGEVFKPKDVNGKDVMTFVFQGTTYAPVRAMAEAFDLKVGYDAEKKMATVGEAAPSTSTDLSSDYSNWTAEEEKLYQEFKGLWKIGFVGVYEAIGDMPQYNKYTADYFGNMNSDEIRTKFKSILYNGETKFLERFKKELTESNGKVMIEFVISNAGKTISSPLI